MIDRARGKGMDTLPGEAGRKDLFFAMPGKGLDFSRGFHESSASFFLTSPGGKPKWSLKHLLK